MFENGLEDLFKDLQSVTGVEDVAYHEIQDGKLLPVHKNHTNQLHKANWQSAHRKNPVIIKNDPILSEVLKRKAPIAIPDTERDERAVKEFSFFGIESILVTPVCEVDRVKGFIVVASIGKKVNFPEDVVQKSEQMVRRFFDQVRRVA